MKDLEKIQQLFSTEKLVVINVGVNAFAEAVAKQPGTEVIQVNWRPLAGGDKEMRDILNILGY